MYKIFNNFNPPPVVKNWHFHYYLVSTFSHVTLCGLSNDPHPLRLVHIVMLTQIKSTKRKYPKPWFDSFQMEMFQFDKKNYSSLSWHAFSKMRLHNLPAIVVQWTPTSQDEARTLLPPEYKKKRRRKPDRGQEVLRLYTQVSLFKDQKSRLMIQRSGHCWSLCRKGLKYFLHTRVVFRFNFPSYTQAPV